MPATAAPRHAYVADGGSPALTADGNHYDFANLEAPRACSVVQSSSTPFDSLNPWIVKGRSPISVYDWLYDSLMEGAPNEEMTAYGLIAESIDAAADGQSAIFHLRPEAKFHDGTAITSADVLFTAGVMRAHARPFWRIMLREAEVTAPDVNTVRIVFTSPVDGRALLGFATMPILPAHYWRGRDFGSTTVEPPLGSGPYRIAAFEPLRRLVWERIEGHWAEHLPTRRGANNFQRVVYEVYLDKTTELIAFLKGDTDLYEVRDMRTWQAAADQVAASQGRIASVTYDAWWPMGMNGFFFNLRDDRFADRRVRQALGMLMPFEWVNRTMLSGAFARTASYFENSVYAATMPPAAAEQAAMRQFPDAFPPAAFERAYVPANADVPAGIRETLRDAATLLKQAGWAPDASGRMRRSADGRPLDFNILASSASQQGLVGAWAAQLRRLGIETQLRVVDPAAYEVALRERDFEVTYRFYIPAAIPGREQVRMWGGPALNPAADADKPGNVFGIDSPAIDHFLGKLVDAQDKPVRIRAARLLDRALQWGHYAVPGYQARHKIYAYNATKVVPVPPAPGRSSATDFWWCRADQSN